MSKTTPLPKHLSESELQEIHEVSRLVKYVVSGNNQPVSGRFFDDKYCLVFWPDIFRKARFKERFQSYTKSVFIEEDEEVARLSVVGRAERVLKDRSTYTEEELQDARKARLVLFSEDAKLQRLKKRTEKLLGPLLIEDASIKQQMIPLYLRNRLRAEYSYPVDPSINNNLNNVTIFRRVQFNEATIARTRPWILPDSSAVLPMIPSVPHILQLLWHACYNAYVPSDVSPHTLGVEFLNTGLIAINWRVFRRSAGWPNVAVSPVKPIPRHYRGVDKLTPKDIMLEIENGLLTKTLKRGIVKFSLDPASFGEIPNGNQHYIPGESRYIVLCRQLHSFALDGQTLDYCTLIDPLILAKNIKLFDGCLYDNKKRRSARIKKLKEGGFESVTRAAMQHSKVLRLDFKPADFLSSAELAYLWVPKTHVEDVYAIRRNQETYLFTRPRYLVEAGRTRGSEAQSWRQAMDGMQLEDEFLDTKDVMGMCDKARSVVYKELTRAYLLPLAEKKTGKHYDDLNPYQQLKIRKAASVEHGENNPDSVGSRIWHDLRRDAVKNRVTRQEAVRSAMVTPLGEDEPRKMQFLTPRAVHCIQKVANGTFRRFELQDEDLTMVLGGTLSPAPYVLAWTRFCESINGSGVRVEDVELQERLSGVRAVVPQDLRKQPVAELIKASVTAGAKNNSISGADKNKRQRFSWWPEEDYVLMTKFYCPYVNARTMTQDRWKELLLILSNRTQSTCHQRVALLNRMLAKCVRKTTLAKIKVGSIKEDELAAIRNLYIIGFVAYRKGLNKKIYPNQKGVNYILKLSDEQIRATGVPPSYKDRAFFKQFDV